MPMCINKVEKNIVLAQKYKPGLEDGFMCFDMSGKYLGFSCREINCDNIKSFPAIFYTNGISIINNNRYIITDNSNNRFVIDDNEFRLFFETI